MAWTTPKTWASGYVVLAADLNTHLRDNISLTAPAVMSSQGDLLIASGANTPIRLAKSTTSTQYLANTGTSNAPAWNEVALATGVSGTLPVGNGGTGQTSLTTGAILIGNSSSAVTMVTQTTKGQILIGDGSGPPQMLGVGDDDQVLTADSGETTGVKWGAAGGGGALTIETFETAIITTATFNTGALSAEPKLAIVFGVVTKDTNNLANSFQGFATGTGTAAKSAGIAVSRTGDGNGMDIIGDADSIGGAQATIPANSNLAAWGSEDLNVTVFSKGSGITLDWSGGATQFSAIKMVVLEFE